MSGHGRRAERGAVIAETAIIASFLLLLALGIAEVGAIVRDTQTVTGATRAATRAISTSGDSRLADHDAIATLAAALNSVDPASVEHIVIFKPEADGSMPAGCETASQTGRCNHYTGADLTLTAAAFDGGTTCTASSPDAAWCPTDREVQQSVGPDWIGISVALRHRSLSPFLDGRIVEDTTVMRLEPRFGT